MVMKQFDSMLSSVIDWALGQRCSSIIGYQYSELPGYVDGEPVVSQSKEGDERIYAA